MSYEVIWFSLCHHVVTGLMLKKIKSEFYNIFFCPHILHATNLIKVWDWSFKQKYLLIKDDNVVKTFANQKLKVDVRKIERWFYMNQLCFSSRLTSLTSMMSFQKNLQGQCTHILPTNFGQQINMLSKLCACAEISF